jgi:hypothetical protein
MLLTHFPLPPPPEPRRRKIDWDLVWLAAFVILLLGSLTLIWIYHPQSLGN